MSFCYNESVFRLAWLGGIVAVVGALQGAPSVVRAQETETEAGTEIEIITEPPQPEPVPEPEQPRTAPPPDEPPAEEKLGILRVGAGFGFGVGGDIITVGFAPMVSYLFKWIVEPGLTIRYQYTNDRFVVPNAIWHTFGGSIFVRLYPVRSLFLLIEGELINTGFTQGEFSSGRLNFGNLLLGGGYVMGVGKGAFFMLSLKVNVFRNAFYPSNIPIIGVGGGFAF